MEGDLLGSFGRADHGTQLAMFTSMSAFGDIKTQLKVTVISAIRCDMDLLRILLDIADAATIKETINQIRVNARHAYDEIVWLLERFPIPADDLVAINPALLALRERLSQAIYSELSPIARAASDMAFSERPPRTGAHSTASQALAQALREFRRN